MLKRRGTGRVIFTSSPPPLFLRSSFAVGSLRVRSGKGMNMGFQNSEKSDRYVMIMRKRGLDRSRVSDSGTNPTTLAVVNV